MSRRAYRLTVVGAGGVLAGYVLVTPQVAGAQHVPDFGAFFAVAHALRLQGWGALPHLYSLTFQVHAGAIFGRSHGLPYVEPFVATPPAALLVLPFSLLPFWAAFYLWDALLLGLGLWGAIWLARGEGLGRASLPVALVAIASFPTYQALGEGQFDLLWPLGLALFSSAWRCHPGWPRGARSLAAALVFSLKPDLLLAAVVPAAHRWRDRRVQELAACLAALGLVSAVAIGVSGVRLLTMLESYTLYHRFPPVLDVTVLGVLWHTVGHGALAVRLAWAATGIGVLALAWAWAKHPPRTAIEWKLALTSAVCISLLVAPHDLPQGLLLLSGPAIWTASALLQAGRSLGWFGAWVVIFNVGCLIDASPHVQLPVPITPELLLLGALVAWRARAQLGQAAEAPQLNPVAAPAGS